MDRQTKPQQFAGIEILPGMRKSNFLLYLDTLLIGMLVIIPSIIQPAFLQDVVQVSDDVSGYTNGFLQNISRVAALAFAGSAGVLSDRIGRKIAGAVTGANTLATDASAKTYRGIRAGRAQCNDAGRLNIFSAAGRIFVRCGGPGLDIWHQRRCKHSVCGLAVYR